jgi:Na+/H+ antiporter NhaD/arsenite permease-like protein
VLILYRSNIFIPHLINVVASALLISSNPTNLVLSGAFSLSFVTYTSSVALPLLAAALTVYPFHSLVLFRSPGLIPSSIELSGDAVEGDRVGVDRPSTALIDKTGAVFGSILLLVTLGGLVGTSTIGVPVWQIAVPAAAMMLTHDMWRDYRSGQVVTKEVSQSDGVPPNGVQHSIELGTLAVSASSPDGNPEQGIKTNLALSSLLLTCAHHVIGKFPGVYGVCKKLPVALVPFAFLMFVLVQGLASQGWVQTFAHWWGAWANMTGVIGAAAGMTIGSGLLCNVRNVVQLLVPPIPKVAYTIIIISMQVCGTNIGTTILLARVVQEWRSSMEAASADVQYASVYGLAIGSNYGAFTLTFSASLAGMLWRDILLQKGIHVRGRQFAGLNVGTFLVASVASGAVLIGQTLRPWSAWEI